MRFVIFQPVSGHSSRGLKKSLFTVYWQKCKGLTQILRGVCALPRMPCGKDQVCVGLPLSWIAIRSIWKGSERSRDYPVWVHRNMKVHQYSSRFILSSFPLQIEALCREARLLDH